MVPGCGETGGGGGGGGGALVSKRTHLARQANLVRLIYSKGAARLARFVRALLNLMYEARVYASDRAALACLASTLASLRSIILHDHGPRESFE